MNKARQVRALTGLPITDCGIVFAGKKGRTKEERKAAYNIWYHMERTGKWRCGTDAHLDFLLMLLASKTGTLAVERFIRGRL